MVPMEKRLRVKQLNEKVLSIKKEEEELRFKLEVKGRELSSVKSEIKNLQTSLKSKPAVVSDHAVLRYLELKYNLERDSVRDEMLSPLVKGAINSGATSVKCGDMKFVIMNKVITSVI